jgi:hypothetical protein
MTKQLILTLIENGLQDLERTAQIVPDDKLNWKPLDNGRTVLDLLGEAAQTPLLVVHLLQSPETFNPYELFPKLMQERAGWTREETFEKLRANTQAALEAIRALPDEELEKPFTLPIGATGNMTLPLAAWVLMPYRTFVSRFAQINYIQTLYGDFEFH